MNTSGLILCFCLSLSAGQQPRDPWFAEDKLMHFAASFAATTLSASAARSAGLEPGHSALLGAATGSGFAIWKEVHDHRRPDGFFSYRDLVWDFAGIGAATGVMRRVR
ncbi:hypothetical protein BH23GEM6_BH23GEM6_05290 [soil metagenome]